MVATPTTSSARDQTLMKALVKEKEGPSYQCKDVPVPSPGKGDLLVKVRKVSLCGRGIIHRRGIIA